MAAPSIPDLLAVGNCFACIPQGTQQLVKLGILAQILKSINPVADISISTLLQNSACYACVPAGQQGLIELALLTDILQAGSIGTDVCLLFGAGPPVNPPFSPNCLFIDNVGSSPTAGGVWAWDIEGGDWFNIIGGL